jgi:regulator of protease activity HflC (stomatin/prohibitin superfamily)
MFTTLMIAVCLVAAVLILIFGKVDYRDLRWVAVVPLIFGLVVLVFAVTYRVGTGEAVVKVSPAGAYLSTDAATGFHGKAPWTRTDTWDLRNNRLEFSGDKHADGGTIHTATSDPVDTWFDMTITYDLQPGGLRAAFNQYRTQDRLEAEQIVLAFASKAKDSPTRYTAVTIRGSRTALQQDMRTDLTARLSDFGVNVSSVDLQDIHLPTNVINNMNDVQASSAATEKKRQELEGVKIDAQKTLVEAKANADADQITRCGATTKTGTETVNGKVTATTVVVPNATCDPGRLNPSVLLARYIDMLQRRSGDTTVVLPPNPSTLLQLQVPSPAGAK